MENLEWNFQMEVLEWNLIMNDGFYQISASHFCCGVVVKNNKVIEAANIIGWAYARPANEVFDYFKKKKYKIKRIENE